MGRRRLYAVAIDGDTLLVGASDAGSLGDHVRGDASKASGVNGAQSDVSATGAGAAYVY